MADVERLRTLFNVFDRDGSGTLDAEELLEILTRGAKGLSLEDAKVGAEAAAAPLAHARGARPTHRAARPLWQEIVSDFDDNKDGVLSMDEFVKAMSAIEPTAGVEPALGDFVEVMSGECKGRVGKVQLVADAIAGVSAYPHDANCPKLDFPKLYNVFFTDVRASAAAAPLLLRRCCCAAAAAPLPLLRCCCFSFAARARLRCCCSRAAAAAADLLRLRWRCCHRRA